MNDPAAPSPFSDYIVFVDESGDHSLDVINPQYPVFVLAFCILPCKAYVEQITPTGTLNSEDIDPSPAGCAAPTPVHLR